MILRSGTATTTEAPPEGRPDYGLIRSEALSDTGGITQFGLFRQTLPPGARTSTRHWHEVEDEVLYVLDGTPTVIENDGPHLLAPGDACCWPGGVANAHCVENRSPAPCVILVLGSRPGDDRCHYPDLGRTQIDEGDTWRLVDDATGAILKGGRKMILRKGSVPELAKTVPYPPPYDRGIGPGTRVSLSDAGGLTQFGLHVETLAPGASSTHRHWHAHQDEMIYLLSGRLMLIDDAGRHEIGPGDAATFPAGEANAHGLVNETEAPATYIVVGARGPQEVVTYAEIDLRLQRDPGGAARFTRADGSPLAPGKE